MSSNIYQKVLVIIKFITISIPKIKIKIINLNILVFLVFLGILDEIGQFEYIILKPNVSMRFLSKKNNRLKSYMMLLR